MKRTVTTGEVKPSCPQYGNISGLLVTTIAVLFVVISSGVDAGKVDPAAAMEFPIDCRPFHMKSMKFLLKNFNKCSRELKANTTSDSEYEENIGCAMKCTMRATGYSENDLVTPDSIRRSCAKLLPNGLVEPVAQTLIKNCHEKFGNKLNPTEQQCRAYSEYAFCIQSTIGDLVDSEFCIKYDRKGQPIPS